MPIGSESDHSTYQKGYLGWDLSGTNNDTFQTMSFQSNSINSLWTTALIYLMKFIDLQEKPINAVEPHDSDTVTRSFYSHFILILVNWPRTYCGFLIHLFTYTIVCHRSMYNVFFCFLFFREPNHFRKNCNKI